MLHFGLRPSRTAICFIVAAMVHGASHATDSDLDMSALAPIIPLEDVRVGMKGYGLSVFHGATIEPFPVVVTSVMRDYFMGLGTGGSQRGLIWIECTDERMQHLGPVYGMSGSPIYLWETGTEAEPGTGGRLIGAFAMGFEFSETCYAAVQPIEQMRQVGLRATPHTETPGGSGHGGHDTVAMLRSLTARGEAEGLRSRARWRLDALADALAAGCAACDDDTPPPPSTTPRGPDPAIRGVARPLLLPVPVASPAMRRVMAPIMRRAGLIPVETGGRAGRPPNDLDASSIQFAPGAVLSLPMVWGDMDYSASGTCTEVWPDGRVLAFGHSMYAAGHASLPIATGFVHMVMPLSSFSFKLGGSALLQPGGLVRDEEAAVVAAPFGTYRTATMNTEVTVDDVPTRALNYRIVHHRLVTPVLAGITALESAIIDRAFPPENTLHMKAELQFEGGRHLSINSHIADTDAMAIAFALIGPLAVMANNPFATVMLEHADLSIRVDPVSEAATLLHVRVDRQRYAPGETVGLTATYRGHHQAPVALRLRFPLPDDLPEGSYGIAISSAEAYASRLLQRRPHLNHVDSVDDLMALLKTIYRLDPYTLHLSMELPRTGLAIRRTELPALPSSRQAMLIHGATASTLPLVDWVENSVALDVLLMGEAVVRINVLKDPGKRP